MKEKIFNFCERFIAGAYETKIGNQYVGTPKVAPIFLVAFLMLTVGDLKDLSIITYAGLFFLATAFFGFFYYNIFPGRLPKGPFDK